MSFGDVLDACAIDSAPGAPTGWGTTNLAKWLLWEDPLLAHLSPQVADKDMALHYEQLAQRLHSKLSLAGVIHGPGSVPMDPHPLGLPAALARVLQHKIRLRKRVETAYADGDRSALAHIIGFQVPSAGNGKHDDHGRSQGRGGNGKISSSAGAGGTNTSNDTSQLDIERDMALGDEGDLVIRVVESLDALHREHYSLWHSHYKPYGWEVIEMRYGAQRARLMRVRDLIEAYVTDQITTIEELDAARSAQQKLMYQGEIWVLPLFCWARAVTPAMPSVRPDSTCPL